MTNQGQASFSFQLEGFPNNLFIVGNFSGTEALSKLYQFDITLISNDPEIDLNAVMKTSATLVVHKDGYDIVFHGIVSHIIQQQAFNTRYIYQAVLVPRLWRTTLTRHNQVFLDQNIPEIIESVLQNSGFTANDYELRLQGNYPAKEYVCQYQESHFNFISRWMEHVGMYFYFEQDGVFEKCIITDTAMAHVESPDRAKFQYVPPSGLESTHWDEVVESFFCHQTLIPESVLLKDYNYRTPDLEITGQAEVDSTRGQGRDYVYGDHFATPEEGQRLAKIRAEEYRCREKRFVGDSRIPFIRPGFLFTLESHFRNDYNQSYLCVDVSHRGYRNTYLIDGIDVTEKETHQRPPYENTFTAIPAPVQFRPPFQTPKTRFHGVINAKIDAAGSGDTAELDDQGRYKVVLPFDIGGREPGKCSAWLRMAQPYVGSSFGMHFPLHKGTEVLLSFVDGDPDRPIISAAVPNPDHPSVVRSGNESMSQLISASQNKIHMEDKEGEERIMLHTPKGNNSIFRIGAPNDPDSIFDWDKGKDHYKEKGVLLSTEGPCSFEVGKFKTEVVTGATAGLFVGAKLESCIAANIGLSLGTEMKYHKIWDIKFGGNRLLKVVDSIEDRVKLVEVAHDVNSVRNHLNTIISGHNSIKNKYRSIKGRVSSLEGKRDDIVDDINTINTKLNSVTGTGQNSYKNKINTAIQVVNSIRTQLNTVKTEVNNVNIRQNTIKDDVTDVKNKLTTSLQNISSSNLTVIN